MHYYTINAALSRMICVLHSFIHNIQHMSVDRCYRAVLEYNRWRAPCMIFHIIYGHSCSCRGSEGLNDRHGYSNLQTVKTKILGGKSDVSKRIVLDTKKSWEESIRKSIKKKTGELSSSSPRLHFIAAGMSLQKHSDSSLCLHPETWSLPSGSHFQTHQTPLTAWPGFF